MERILYLFKRIAYVINIPRHIKKYFLKKKLKRYRNDQQIKYKLLSVKVINFFMVMLISAGFVYLNLNYRNLKLLLGSSTLLGVMLLVILMKKIKKRKENESRCREVSSLILKDENGEIINKWNINESPSLLIGKKTKINEVDVDLSDATYSSLISREHAVMNNTGEKWYFEDIGSSNGSGIRRKVDGEKFKLEVAKPYQLNKGDMIYIANTKLLVK
jgi:hypothetical protein